MKNTKIKAIIILLLMIFVLFSACKAKSTDTNLNSSLDNSDTISLSSSEDITINSYTSSEQPNKNSSMALSSQSKVASNSLKSSAVSSATSSNTSSTVSSVKPELTEGSDLHVTGNAHNLGDVHPYYNSSNSKWYMFYLANIGNKFVPKLVTSKDMIRWTVEPISHTGYNSKQTYYVLGVLKTDNKYYSFYGNGAEIVSSESNNLLSWKNALFISVPNDNEKFPAGACDPYVFLNSSENVFSSLAVAYRANKYWGVGSNIDCSLVLSNSLENNIDSFTSNQRELIRFPNAETGRPECPQMFKLGNRWYLLTSLYGRSNNGVGRPTYWIGDADKKILDNNWQDKKENSLDGDDLCAAQVATDGNSYHMWGWIPKSSSGGSWGGHLNLAREIYQTNDGSLGVKLDSSVGNKIRGRELTNIPSTTLEANNVATFKGLYNRLDIDLKIRLNSSTTLISIGSSVIKVDGNKNELRIYKGSAAQDFSSIILPSGALTSLTNLRIIAESDIIEIFVNNKWALSARTDALLTDAQVKLTSIGGSTIIESAKIYRLKFLEEI